MGNDAYIGLRGQSMGAATVMLYGGTHENSVKFIIEDCGFTRANEAIKFQFQQAKIPVWPLYNLVRGKVRRKYDVDFNVISPLEAIRNSNVPILFIHGTEDNIGTAWMAEKLYNSKKGEKDRLYLVDKAGHMQSSCKNREKYKEAIREFIDSIK